MPSPLIHSAVAIAAARTKDAPLHGRLYVLSLVASNYPDLDMIPGLLLGDMHRFHHLYTHSLLAALCVALILAACAWEKTTPGTPYATRLRYLLLLCLSHPMLDLFNDDRFSIIQPPPSSLILFWPLSPHPFHPIYPLFRTAVLNANWRSLLWPSNLRIYALDVLLGTALVVAVAMIKRQGKSAKRTSNLVESLVEVSENARHHQAL